MLPCRFESLLKGSLFYDYAYNVEQCYIRENSATTATKRIIIQRYSNHAIGKLLQLNLKTHSGRVIHIITYSAYDSNFPYSILRYSTSTKNQKIQGTK